MCHLYRCPQLTSEEEVAQADPTGMRGTARNLAILRIEYRRVRVIQAMLISGIEQRARQIEASRAHIERLEREMQTSIEHMNMLHRRRRNFSIFIVVAQVLPVIAFVVFYVVQYCKFMGYLA